MSFLCLCSGHSTKKQLSRGRFFVGLQNHMENKNEGNENKIILADFNCTMDKMERDRRNKTLYKCHFNYAQSKLIMDNGLEDLWRREKTDSSAVTYYNRSSGTGSTINRVYTDIKMAINTKINDIMASLLIIIMLFLLTGFPQKLKLEKIHGTLKIPFYVSLSFP